MSDKIENRPQQAQQQESDLTNFAYGLMKAASEAATMGAAGLAGAAMGRSAQEVGRAALEGAAMGAGAGAVMGKTGAAIIEGATIGGAAGAAVGGALKALEQQGKRLDHDLKKGDGHLPNVIKGAIENGIKNGIKNGGQLPNVIIEGAAGAAGGAVGNKVVQENKKEIDAIGNAIKKEAQRQVKDLLDTPKDVMDHIQKRPVTAAAEAIIAPPLVIIDSKLRKYFGK
jgi:hypothetical protein